MENIIERLKKTARKQNYYFGVSYLTPQQTKAINEMTPGTGIYHDYPGENLGFDAEDFILWEIDIAKEFGLAAGDSIFKKTFIEETGERYENIETVGDVIRIIQLHITFPKN